MFTPSNLTDFPSEDIRGRLVLVTDDGGGKSRTGTLKPPTTPQGPFIWIPDTLDSHRQATFHPDSETWSSINGIYSELSLSQELNNLNVDQLQSDNAGKLPSQSSHCQLLTNSEESVRQTPSSELSPMSKRMNPKTGNPLHNELILENIFKNLDYKNLKSARLVCKSWSEILFSKFERSTNVRMNFSLHKKNGLSTFVKTFSVAYEERRMYRRMSLMNPRYFDFESMKEWMSKYGKYIKYVQLGSHEQCDISQECYELMLLKWCPNLQHLSIPYPTLASGYDFNLNKIYPLEERVVCLKTLEIGNTWECKKEIDQFLILTLKMVKSLTSLTLKSGHDTTEEYNLMTLSNFLWKEQNNYSVIIESLSSLDLSKYLCNSSAFDTLTKLNFKSLKHLKSSNPPDLHFENFLSKVGFNLESLQFHPSSLDLPLLTTLTLPEMMNLKLLHLELDYKDMGSLDFMLQIPNLIYLKTTIKKEVFLAERRSYGFTKKSLKLEKQKHKNLETWEIESNRPRVFDAESLVKCFPSLKKLIAVEYTGEFYGTLAQLCWLRKLEHLEIGIYGDVFKGFFDAFTEYIPLFKELKTLKLRHNSIGQRHGEKIVKKDVQNGFFKAPKLISLHLAYFWISLDAKKLLLSRSDLKVEIHEPVSVHNYYSDSWNSWDSTDSSD